MTNESRSSYPQAFEPVTGGSGTDLPQGSKAARGDDGGFGCHEAWIIHQNKISVVLSLFHRFLGPRTPLFGQKSTKNRSKIDLFCSFWPHFDPPGGHFLEITRPAGPFLSVFPREFLGKFDLFSVVFYKIIKNRSNFLSFFLTGPRNKNLAAPRNPYRPICRPKTRFRG